MDGTLKKDGNGDSVAWSYNHITTISTTLVKTGAGFLHTLTINGGWAPGVIELDDALTNTTPQIALITSSASAALCLIYDLAFSTGLSVTTSVAAQDITITYI